MVNDHLSFDQFLAYVSGRMDSDESFAVETHMATCAQCAQRAKAHFFIK